MTKLNLDFQLIDLAGKPIEGFSVKESVANTIVSGNTGSPIRMYEYALKLFKDGEIDISDEDLPVVKRAIESSKLSDLVKAQILQRFPAK